MRRIKHWTNGYNPGSIGGSFAFSRTISLVMAFLLIFSGFLSGWCMETARADGADSILYVKMEGDDANGGTGWDDAFATLQKALDTADTSGGQTYQIWIAKGTYIPTHTLPASSVCVERIPDPPNPPESWLCVEYEMQVDPQTAHFAMKNDVAIYGGFAGTEDPASFSLADRDFANNETILSGDLGNGLASYHVFYHVNLALDATAVLDGVTISGGRGVEHQGYGGGMYNDRSSPALTHVTFSGNYAQYAGGAMANQSSNPTLTHVTISGNEARAGGGIYNSGSSPILTHVTISDNKAFINEGGGMSNNSGSSPVLTHVTISGNEANIGGGMYNSDSSPTLTNVTISGNKARDISPGGRVGGGIYTRNGSLTLTHVTISGNWAASEAGGMYNDESATTIKNSIIWGNSTTDNDNPNIVISPWWSTSPAISHSLIEYSNGSGDNWNASVGSDDGNNIDADPKFIDYQLATIDSTSSGDYRLRKDSPAINAGNNIDIPNGIITDLDGNIRVTGASVDMGAYEYERVLPVPRNLIGTAGDRQVTLSWDVVNFADNYEVYKYEGATGPVTTDDWERVASDINVTTYEVTELTNGTGYAFAVKAVSTLGDSDFTDAAIATPSTVPDAPSGVSATAGNEQAVVSFTAPTNNSGSAITGYTVTALVNGSATGITATGTASPITVSGLTNGTAYTFTVRATNALGDSAESDPSGEVTPRTVPDAPSGVSATAGNEQAVVSFTAPTNTDGSAITGYTVTALVNGSATGITATGTASPITVSGLTNGTAYTFTVRATNAAGDSAESDASDEVTPRTVPDAPSDVSATAGNEQAVVSFTVPTNNSGSAITGYTVTALVNGSATGITAIGTASPITVSGLTNGTAYTFTVRATNALGDSAESDPSGEVTPRTVPDAPSDVSATAGNRQAVVSFTAPTNNGGSAITGYTVTALVNGSATGITATGTASPTTVSGLTNGTAYTFTVRATNAAGDSAESSPTEPTTPLPPASVPDLAPEPVPDAPTESGNNSLVVLVISTNGSIIIPVGGSGEVNLGEEISIVIPDGASEREQHITIEKVLNTGNLISEGEILASAIYELMKNFAETFDKPVTLTLVFDPSVAGSNQTFAIFYYDETEKKWIKVGGEVSGNTIRAEVDQFMKFAVFAIDEEASAADRNVIVFSDIFEHWAEESIKQAVLDGIITGYPDGTFRPDEPVSRAEFTVMLAHALGLDGAGAVLPFTDRAEIGAWAEEAVARAVLAGIVNGYGDGRFQPNAPITRSEMATMIARALQLPTEAITQTDFTDDDRIPGWAKSAVESLRKLNIVNGRGDGKYVPDDKLTRAESVVALLRMLRSYGQD